MILVSIKKAKGVNKNDVARISHNEYKDVLLNKDDLRRNDLYDTICMTLTWF